MLKSHNPYNVLSEIISFENVQQMGEMIALKTLRGRYAYARQTLEWLYVGFVKDLNRSNDSHHVFSDAYDLAQTAICFLCEFVGKSLNDVYMIKNGQEITIKKATYLLVGRTIDRMRRYMSRSRDINDYTEELSVEIDHYEEKDYTEVDNKIELLTIQHSYYKVYMKSQNRSFTKKYRRRIRNDKRKNRQRRFRKHQILLS